MSAPALVVVDVQRAFDDPSWGVRNNPGCERNIASLEPEGRYDVRFVLDATHTFDRPDPFGGVVPADELRS